MSPWLETARSGGRHGDAQNPPGTSRPSPIRSCEPDVADIDLGGLLFHHYLAGGSFSEPTPGVRLGSIRSPRVQYTVDHSCKVIALTRLCAASRAHRGTDWVATLIGWSTECRRVVVRNCGRMSSNRREAVALALNRCMGAA